MSHRLITLLLTAALLAAVPAAAQATPIARPGASTDVREHQGTIVFSRYDAAAGTYRLAIRRPGAQPEDVPGVAPADRTFEADIGPDSNGKPQLIYQRCDETCDLFVYSLVRGTGERPVRNANDPASDDVAPTLWKGRIAWARIYGEQRDRKVVVYTKRLTAPRSRPSTRLPGVPQRRCGDIDRDRCGRTLGRAVDALELWGDNLAQVVSYECNGCAGIAQTEMRLVDVEDRDARQIARQTVGLSGQQYVGPSFFAGRLAWYKACLGDPEGCKGDRHGPFRVRISTGERTKGEAGPARVDGFADTGSRLYEVVGCSPETSGDVNRQCRIEELDAPPYAATSGSGR